MWDYQETLLLVQPYCQILDHFVAHELKCLPTPTVRCLFAIGGWHKPGNATGNCINTHLFPESKNIHMSA